MTGKGSGQRPDTEHPTLDRRAEERTPGPARSPAPVSPAVPVRIAPNEQASVLLHEYDALRTEIVSLIGFYKAHVRNFQILIGALLGILGFALAHAASIAGGSDGWLTPTAQNWRLWLGLAVAIPVATGYMVLDIVESAYSLILVSTHLAGVERAVNRIAGTELLTWESKVSPDFWKSFVPRSRVLNPNWLLAGFQTALFLGVNFAMSEWILDQLLGAKANLHVANLSLLVWWTRIGAGMVTVTVSTAAIWVGTVNRGAIRRALGLGR
jgi:hypothetical protein